MATTRQEAACELGRVYVKDNGCEQVEFTDLTGHACRLMQVPGSDSVSLVYSDNYRVFARHQLTAIVATLGRLLETGSMVNTEGCP
jgi:hypothetical protein